MLLVTHSAKCFFLDIQILNSNDVQIFIKIFLMEFRILFNILSLSFKNSLKF